MRTRGCLLYCVPSSLSFLVFTQANLGPVSWFSFLPPRFPMDKLDAEVHMPECLLRPHSSQLCSMQRDHVCDFLFLHVLFVFVCVCLPAHV